MKELDIFEDYVRQKEDANLEQMKSRLRKMKAESTGTKEYVKSIQALEKKISEEEKRLGK